MIEGFNFFLNFTVIINQVKFNLDYGHRITRDDIPIILAIPALRAFMFLV